MSDPEDEEEFCVEGGCHNVPVNGARCEAHATLTALRAWLEREIAEIVGYAEECYRRDEEVTGYHHRGRERALRAVLAQIGGSATP